MVPCISVNLVKMLQLLNLETVVFQVVLLVLEIVLVMLVMEAVVLYGLYSGMILLQHQQVLLLGLLLEQALVI